MTRLVAVDIAGGPDLVDTLRRIWDRGDAVAPLPALASTAVKERAIRTVGADLLLRADGVESPVPRLHADADRWPELLEGDALVMPTSGTSGLPKAAVLTHQALEYAAYASTTAVGVDPDAAWLACLPLHHIGGFGVVARAMLTGAPVVVHPQFDAAEAEAAARAGATLTSLVPTALRRLNPWLFRTILLGGSHLPDPRPTNTIGTYGMTESCGGVVYDGLPLPGVGVRIDDDGQILLSSPTLLRCYRDGTDPVRPDGWYPTGDLGRRQPGTDHLEVFGRAGDVIVTGGEKVWPTDVEAVLIDCPGVVEVAVVGVPDREWGERVVAVAVLDPAAVNVDLALLRSMTREQLGAPAAPKELVVVSSLPRTDSGKLRRAALKEQLMSRN